MKKFLLPAILALAGLGFIFGPVFFSSGSIDVSIQPASVIMPAAYKVYANPDVANGRYNLFKAIVKNTGSSEIHNFKVQFRVPKYIDDWTDVQAPPDLLPGQEAVVICFPEFPQSITGKNTSSKEKTEIRFLYGSKANPTERDESFGFDMTSVNDIVFSDMADKDKAYSSDYGTNMDLYACMLASEDPIIKHYTQLIVQKMNLEGEQAAAIGTAGTGGEKEVAELQRVMKGVYEATRTSGMVYSETAASEQIYGDNTTGTEHIRLPREVVTGNTGLCIELALLHASCLKAMGDHAVIFLIPGHAFPGVKLDNYYYALESTGIGGAGLGGSMTADQALQTGMKEAQDFFNATAKGLPGYYLLDMDELSNEGYKEMELKDDPTMRTEIDQLADKFENATVANQQQQVQNNQPQEQQLASNNENNSNRETSMLAHNGNISFQYPSNWAQRNRPVPQLPILTSTFSSPGGVHGAIEIYQVPGASSPEQAMGYIQQNLARFGVQARYQGDGAQNGLTRFTGVSMNRNQSYRWESFMKVVNGGVEAVFVGAGKNASFTNLHQQIMGSMQ